MPTLKHVLFGTTLLKMTDPHWSLGMGNTQGMKNYFFLQDLMTFYELQKNFKTSFSSELKQNQMKLAPIYSWIFLGISILRRGWMKTWHAFTMVSAFLRVCGALEGKEGLTRLFMGYETIQLKTKFKWDSITLHICLLCCVRLDITWA